MELPPGVTLEDGTNVVGLTVAESGAQEYQEPEEDPDDVQSGLAESDGS